jgi:hypothetical protein
LLIHNNLLTAVAVVAYESVSFGALTILKLRQFNPALSALLCITEEIAATAVVSITTKPFAFGRCFVGVTVINRMGVEPFLTKQTNSHHCYPLHGIECHLPRTVSHLHAQHRSHFREQLDYNNALHRSAIHAWHTVELQH